MELGQIVKHALNVNASDIFITSNHNVYMRINKDVQMLNIITSIEDVNSYITKLLSKLEIQNFKQKKTYDFSIDFTNTVFCRVNLFLEKGLPSMVIRLLQNDIRNLEQIGAPCVIKNLIQHKQGLVLICGPTGSGKSTTMAALINEIMEKGNSHIVTLEDPVEYRFESGSTLVHQRELGKDFNDFPSGLRAALRQDPDVVVIGEMRDAETIKIALTAAETGHLVLATIHTASAALTVSRILSTFDGIDQGQVSTQLSTQLRGIISQRLYQRIDGEGLVPAFEVLVNNIAVGNLIKNGRIQEIQSFIQMGKKEGMISFEDSLQDLKDRGVVAE